MTAMNYVEQSKARPHGTDGGSYIHPTVKVHGGKAYLDLTGDLEIRDGVIINTGVVIYTHNHQFGFRQWREMPITYNPLIIYEDAWIGRNAMIMPSVKYIGYSCILAPGSVLTKSMPDYEMWGGNPAKFIKKVL